MAIIRPKTPMRGGLILDGQKHPAIALASGRAPIPPELRIPLLQPYGGEANPILETGARVLRGTVIARTPPPFSTPIHASSSGTLFLEQGPLPLEGRPTGPMARIETDGRDCSEPRLPPLAPKAPLESWLARLQSGGIIGLGGGGFPSHRKFRRALEAPRLLLINAVECEPYLSADHRLAEEEAHRILEMCTRLAGDLGFPRVIIALEDLSGGAVDALDLIARNHSIPVDLLIVEPRYPAGSERQLIAAATGEELPAHETPAERGILVLNLGTLFAIGRAVIDGEVLTERLITIAGDALPKSQNLWTRIGTPAEFLVRTLIGHVPEGVRWQFGGPMMGLRLEGSDWPVLPTTTAVLVMAPAPAETERPCIRCGDCQTVCPQGLSPQLIHAEILSGRIEQWPALGLSACIACRACDLVCPSQIPLTPRFKAGKRLLAARAEEEAKALRARSRYEAREQRLALEAARQKRESEARKARLTETHPTALAATLDRLKPHETRTDRRND